MQSRFKLVASCLAVMPILVNCSSSATSTDETVDTETGASSLISEIGDLPRASAAVVDMASASRSLQSGAPAFLAETGLVLSEASADSFTTDSSMAMCLSTQSVKQSLKNMTFADMVMCYIQSAIAADVNADAIAEVDIYDGEPHVFRLNLLNDPFAEEDSEEAGEFLVRIQIEKTGDVITDFKMWSCEGGSQQEYMNYRNSDAFSITIKSTWNDEQGAGAQISEVTGDLDELDGEVAFTSKTLESQYYSEREDGENFGYSTFEQLAESVTFSSYEEGEFAFGTFVNKVYSLSQLLNTDSMADISIGSGAAQYLMSGTHEEFEHFEYEETGIESWNGDDTFVEDENDFTESVAAATLPDAQPLPEISFGEGETFDCDNSEAIDIVIDFEAEDVTSCNELQSLDSEYIDCWGTINSGGGEGE